MSTVELESDERSQDLVIEDSWSAPNRYSAMTGQQLSSIPTEIYLEFIAYIQPTPATMSSIRSYTARRKLSELRRNDLRRLSRTCRFLRTAISPILFESIEFCSDPDEKDLVKNPMLGSFVASLNREENAASALALHVKVLILRRGPDWWRDDSVMSYSTAFSKLRHLESVMLADVLPFPLLLGLSPNITSLTINRCAIDTVPVDLIRKAEFHFRLKTFRLYHTTAMNPSVMEALSLLTTTVTELSTNVWSLIEKISSFDIIPPLEVLDLRVVRNLETLFDFLRLLPALKSLTLEDPTPEGVSKDTRFSLSCLKNLQNLTFPPSLVPWFHGPHNLSTLSLPSDTLTSLFLMRGQALRQPFPDYWLDLAQYQSLSVLAIPYAIATQIRSGSDSDRPINLKLKKLSIIFSTQPRHLTFDKYLEMLSAVWASSSIRELHWVTYSEDDFMTLDESVPARFTEKQHFPELTLLSFHQHSQGRGGHGVFCDFRKNARGIWKKVDEDVLINEY
ncbi:hypothetical protein BDP27DRAFT_1334827 [Rhodocollybia butyracea]|uniref:Uncharacterized protein n=1 Tax=Rhodocollybia butyracea TaxID=206335 RepID=A0A9P5PGW9_9AGAR|nr:hypothetical protein BDP27DRAFT_1334827 [Rhodocollybia butyracea]